ncbi:MAG TPA: secretion protein HlyD, partial [Bryobacteraceae bacterium]|nr:secretion protein HlyD [Bryobacteraceae bacterium]
MKKKWKIILAIVGVLVVASAGFAAYTMKDRGVVAVQTGRVVRQDLASVVTASGEIKPRNYINLGANTMGPARINQILVTEGARVD